MAVEDDESFFFPDDFRGVFGIVKKKGMGVCVCVCVCVFVKKKKIRMKKIV